MHLPRPTAPSARNRQVLGLGLTQMLGWGSSYYLPGVLATSISRDLQLPTHLVFAAFSWALVVSALVGPLAGRALDRFGPRPVLGTASLLFASGLALLSQAQGLASMFIAWTLVGLAMASGLYEAAFSALVRFYGEAARRPITGITLMGGLASTVGWPLSAWLDATLGWRVACMTWAALHLLVALPLHLRLKALPMEGMQPAALWRGGEVSRWESLPPAQQGRAAALLAAVFALTWFISTAMAAHLPALLQAQGLSLAGALLLGSLFGPAQVIGRLAEYRLLRHLHPLISARLAGAMHPLGAVALLLAGAPAGAVFTLLHGAGTGVLTIAQGTLPLVLFGTAGYGVRQGWLMLPARLAQAAAPFLFGLCFQAWGGQALWLSAALGALCLLALCLLPNPRRAQAAVAGA